MFKKPEKLVLQKIYPFRNVHNELIVLFDEVTRSEDDYIGEKKLIRQMREEYKEVKRKFG